MDEEIVRALALVASSREVELRLEVFHLTNRFNYGNPIVNLSNQNFGRTQEYALGLTPRVMQLGMKLNF